MHDAKKYEEELVNSTILVHDHDDGFRPAAVMLF